MRVNFDPPKKVYSADITPKQKRKLMVKFWKHIARSSKRK